MERGAENEAGGWQRLLRLWHTVKPLAFRQVSTRVRVRCLRQWWRLTGRTAGPERHLNLRDGPPRPAGPHEDMLLLEMAEARTVTLGIAKNRFSFLGETQCFAAEVDWHIPAASRLWRYHLHYFKYVREFMLTDLAGGSEGESEFRRLAASWIASNQRWEGDGWHPYTISLRIVAWLKAGSFWAPAGASQPAWWSDLGGSLRGQACALQAQLEHDVRGNHLFENGRALVWLGLLASDDDAGAWFSTGLRILEAEIPEQVLADGCHFERCPGYHFSVLQSLVELGCLFELCGRKAPDWLRKAVRRMADFGARILQPDGNYPLFKDSARDQVVVPPHAILTAASRWLTPAGPAEARARDLASFLYFGVSEPEANRPLPALASNTGYCIAQGRNEAVAFDAGVPCPDYLPAHAHADSLGFEFFAGGAPLVVDPGIFEYTAGPWRDHFRSTAAHSTIGIDGQNSSDVWGSFRVGRRARVRQLASEIRDGAAQFVAEHDGFAHLPGRPIHRRLLSWREGQWLVVLDFVSGDGEHHVDSRLQFHPSVEVGEPRRCDAGWRMALEPAGWYLLTLGETQPVLTRGQTDPRPAGWVSEAFGVRKPATLVTHGDKGPLPRIFASVLSTDPGLRARVMRDVTGWNLELDSRYGHDTCKMPGADRTS